MSELSLLISRDNSFRNFVQTEEEALSVGYKSLEEHNSDFTTACTTDKIAVNNKNKVEAGKLYIDRELDKRVPFLSSLLVIEEYKSAVRLYAETLLNNIDNKYNISGTEYSMKEIIVMLRDFNLTDLIDVLLADSKKGTAQYGIQKALEIGIVANTSSIINTHMEIDGKLVLSKNLYKKVNMTASELKSTIKIAGALEAVYCITVFGGNVELFKNTKDRLARIIESDLLKFESGIREIYKMTMISGCTVYSLARKFLFIIPDYRKSYDKYGMVISPFGSKNNTYNLYTEKESYKDINKVKLEEIL